jgi:hypothetical protein
MALLKTIREINKFIPKKDEWLKNRVNTYSNIEHDPENKLYAFMFNPKTKELIKTTRVEFCVYKGVGMVYLLLVDYNGDISSLTPSVAKELKKIVFVDENEWEFQTDTTGVKIITNSPRGEYLIYFGEDIKDLPKFGVKYTLTIEPVYV